MSIRNKFIKMKQDRNPEKFNESTIYYKENNQDLTKVVDAVCKALTIIPNIEYLGCKISPIKNIYKNTKTEKEIPTDVSRFELITMNFKITKNAEVEYIEKTIYFPKLINGHCFIINGHEYFPVYQMVDSGTYRTKKSLTLKTLLMPIVLKDEKITLEDVDGNVYNTKIIKIDLFKNNINIFLYYFANFGYNGAIDYFKLTGKIRMVDSKDEIMENETLFLINKNKGFAVDKEFISHDNNMIIIATLMNNFSSRMKIDKDDKNYWIKKLGSNFTKNNSNQQYKGESLLLSFYRILDEITKDVLRIENPEDKEDTFAIVRWMCYNFDLLSQQDNMNLANKRLRLYEYLIHPLLIKFSVATYRILNSKNVTMGQLKTIFSNIPKGFLVKELIKHELIRYKGSTNSYDLFSVMLKGTCSGPQSFFSGGNVNVKFRDIHPSYMGYIDICTTANGDPGVSFTISPFCELKKNLHFSEIPTYEFEK